MKIQLSDTKSISRSEKGLYYKNTGWIFLDNTNPLFQFRLKILYQSGVVQIWNLLAKHREFTKKWKKVINIEQNLDKVKALSLKDNIVVVFFIFLILGARAVNCNVFLVV